MYVIEKESSTGAPGENPQVVKDCSSSESSSVDDVSKDFSSGEEVEEQGNDCEE